MKPSDITLLRKELAKAVVGNRNLQKKIFEIEATPTKRNTLLELEDDCLRRELAARDMRMETYENSDAPPPHPRVRCTIQSAPPSERRWKKGTCGRTDLNQMVRTRHARGRLRVTPAHRTATRQKEQSRCACLNARRADAGTSPGCRPR